ncbi:hypothetical protein ACFYUR_19250 [Micromonospora haikouensis]|uniref:hypothetical protein n=1 Tax=Micromonospora haikouensis TaxID=686309 RepID=UPI0036740BA5
MDHQPELIAADGTLTDHIADVIGEGAHTHEEDRLDPGVYVGPRYGHALVVGTNKRSLTVLDFVGVINVGGVDVADPEHLETLGRYFLDRAQSFRERSTRPNWPPS